MAVVKNRPQKVDYTRITSFDLGSKVRVKRDWYERFGVSADETADWSWRLPSAGTIIAAEVDPEENSEQYHVHFENFGRYWIKLEYLEPAR